MGDTVSWSPVPPNIYLFIFLLLRGAAYGISVPQPGVEPVPHAVEAQSPKHGTAEDFCSFYAHRFTVLTFLLMPLL